MEELFFEVLYVVLIIWLVWALGVSIQHQDPLYILKEVSVEVDN